MKKYYVVSSYPYCAATTKSLRHSWHRSYDVARSAAERLSKHTRSDVEIAIHDGTSIISRASTGDLFTGLVRRQHKVVSATLHDYQTGEAIRAATANELAASIHAAETDGGIGVIMVKSRSCYVQE